MRERQNVIERVIVSQWRPFILSLIGAAIPILGGAFYMQERFVKLEEKHLQLEIRVEEHSRWAYHPGMVDYALSEESFQIWADGFRELEESKYNQLDRRMNNVELDIKEILKAVK